MSNYFGALMRASAMTVSGVAPPRAVPRAAPSLSLDVVGEHVAPVLQVHAQAASALPSVAAASAPAQLTAERSEHAAGTPTHDAMTPASKVDPVARTQPEVPPQGVAAPEPEVSPAHEVVRAAMRWVAAGPRQPAPAASERALHDEGAVSRAEADEATPRAPRDVRVDLAEAVAPPTVVAQVDAPARAALPSARAALAVPAADERVEVSIGTIHLRVDAPAPQVAASTRPVAAPPVRSAHVAPTPRSALARRALRRI